MLRFWNALADLVTRRARLVLVAALLVTVVLALGIPQLEFETSQDSLIGEDDPVAKDNARFQESFGGEPMLILFSATDDDTTVVDLIANEDNAEALAELDAELRATGLFHSVVSPLAAMEFAASQTGPGLDIFANAEEYAPALAREQFLAGGATEDQAAAAAEQVSEELADRSAGTQARIVGAGEPATEALALQGIDDPVAHTEAALDALSSRDLTEALLFESDPEDQTQVLTDADGTPVVRPILRANFPAIDQALSVIATQGNIDIADMGAAADEVQRIGDEYRDRFEGFELTIGGPPELLQDINDYLQEGLLTLGGLSFLVMLVVLFFVFRVRWRLLSLVIVIIGAIWGFGIMGYLGIPLTLITIAALPILIGVGVDFSIQAHSRFEEEVDTDGDAGGSMHRLMRNLAPPLAVAAIAAVVGFLALRISAVPLIGQFGYMLAIGIAALFIAGVTVPTSILVLRERRRPTAPGEARIPHGFLERVVRWMMFAARRFVLPMGVIGVVVIVLGLAFEGRFVIETDPEKWLPQDSETIETLGVLQERAGFSSVLGVLIESDDASDDDVSSWAQQFTNQQMQKHGPEGDNTLKDVSSLYGVAFDITKTPPDQESIDLLIGKGFDDPPAFNVAPDDVLRSTMSPDKQRAALQFPIAPISLGEREELLDEIAADLEQAPDAIDVDVRLFGFPEVGGPPDGTAVNDAGLAAVGVELVKSLEANRQLITFTGLGAVALWLLLFFRRIWKAGLVLVPVLIAVGLSSVVTFATGITLSPMTSVSAPLVIATSTEFVVLILARYVEERERGLTPEEAVDVGGVRIGRAFVASGLTTVGGFLVLAASPFPLVWQFGVLVALNVLVALISALVVLPPLLIWADRNPRIKSFVPGPRPEKPAPEHMLRSG